MNEIDDTYKQETEDLDNAFVESHNLGRTKSSTINKYLSGLKKSREKFDKNYEKYLRKERRKIWHSKKKKKKFEKFKRLNVKRFDFDVNPVQKFFMRLSVGLFNIYRVIKRFFILITPKKLVYLFYKIARGSSSFAFDSRNYVDRKKKNAASSIKNFFKNLLEKIKTFVKKISAKMKSLGPKKKVEEGEEGEGDKGEEKKGEEVKEEKEEEVKS